MARIPRWTQKIFAGSAANNGQFGSAQVGTKVLSTSLATLQALSAYGTGWLDAVIGTKKFPALEEFQALSYIETTQLAYLFQEGIPAYDAGTEYFTNSIVKKAGTYQIYGSLIDNNIGNALPVAVSDANWQYLQDLSATVPDATTSVKGKAQLAQVADVQSLNTTKIVTPDLLAAYGFRTGDGKEHWTATLQAGWVWADGKTIGNASSNATNRANADTLALFTALWTAYPYTGPTANAAAGELQIYTSGGVAVARGADAATDYAANRAIAVIDKRGRASFGKDNMGGTAAGRLTGQIHGINGQILGGTGGEEAHTQTVAELATHHHTQYNNVDGGSDYGISSNNDNVNLPAVTGDTGTSTPFNVVPPGIVCNYILKL